MGDRLKKLWRRTVPRQAACPLPDRRRVLRRVMAEAVPRRSLRLHRAVRWAGALAAVLVLLTVTAAAGGTLSEYSVFSGMLRDAEPSEYALSLVDMEPKSVSSNGYTMTVTSSVADDSRALFTLEIRPETEEAREVLASEDFYSLTNPESVLQWANGFGPIALSASWVGWQNMSSSFKGYDPETDSVQVDVSMDMGPALWRQVSVHLSTMDDDVWLRFDVNRVPSVTVSLAEMEEAPGVYKVRLSPLSVWVEYVVEETQEERRDLKKRKTMPPVSVLWEDGTLTNLWELDIGGASGSGRSSDDDLWHYKYYWRFRSVQDFSEVIAVVYEGMVYPLDGGESYALEETQGN
ncbi:MAG: DUF4179 domain-containing protein [Oscillospiraceae bacterium]|jgi:hypothetical protein|nr:DUF4179 domain-containing protein [Oscillospiraceae bacterium]